MKQGERSSAITERVELVQRGEKCRIRTDSVCSRPPFQVQDLRNASPATVSRAGIIFVSSSDLGTEPIVQAWLASRREDESAILRALYAKYILGPSAVDLYNWCTRNVSNVMRVSDVHMITNRQWGEKQTVGMQAEERARARGLMMLTFVFPLLFSCFFFSLV